MSFKKQILVNVRIISDPLFYGAKMQLFVLRSFKK